MMFTTKLALWILKVLITFLYCIAVQPTLGQFPTKSIDAEFQVGFNNKILETVNPDGKSVKIQISQWHPLNKINKKIKKNSVSLAEYGMYSAYRNVDVSPDYKPSKAGIDVLKKFLLQFSKDDSRAMELIDAKREVYSNPIVKKGKWPVLLYVSSLNAEPSENFWLFEYLASKGYIILAIPSVGKDSVKSRFIKQDIESQYHAISAVLQYAKKQSNVDTSNIFASGFSLGGIAAALLSLNHPEIKALVTLDGTMSYRYLAIKELISKENQKLNKPYLQLNQRSIKRLPLDTSFFYKHSSANAHLLQFSKLDHIDYASLFILSQSLEADSAFRKRQIATYGTANNLSEKIKSHLLMCQIIYDFLQSIRLKKEFAPISYTKNLFEFILSK